MTALLHYARNRRNGPNHKRLQQKGGQPMRDPVGTDLPQVGMSMGSPQPEASDYQIMRRAASESTYLVGDLFQSATDPAKNPRLIPHLSQTIFSTLPAPTPEADPQEFVKLGGSPCNGKRKRLATTTQLKECTQSSRIKLGCGSSTAHRSTSATATPCEI